MPRTKDCLGFVVSFKILELVKKEFACFVDSKRNRSDKCNLKLLNSRLAATWPCIGEIFRDTAGYCVCLPPTVCITLLLMSLFNYQK